MIIKTTNEIIELHNNFIAKESLKEKWVLLSDLKEAFIQQIKNRRKKEFEKIIDSGASWEIVDIGEERRREQELIDEQDAINEMKELGLCNSSEQKGNPETLSGLAVSGEHNTQKKCTCPEPLITPTMDKGFCGGCGGAL